MSEVAKTQAVRLVDVLVLGPFMLWAARNLNGWERDAMMIAGAATILYNGANYLEQARRLANTT